MSNKQKLRLGYLVSQYPALSHTFVLREIIELRNQGFEIEVASINSPDRRPTAFTSVECEESARTFYVKNAGSIRAALAVLRLFAVHPLRFFRGVTASVGLARLDAAKLVLNLCYLSEAALLTRWMKQKHLRHLHVHFATPAATVALLVSHIAPVSTSLTVHGPDEFYDVSRYFLRQKIAAARFLCAIGQFARSQLMALAPPEHWQKFEVTPLGVDLDCFQAAADGPLSSAFEVLCVGRLVPVKGHRVLLQALAHLRAENRSITLRLVGDGPERASLEREVEQLGLTGCVCFEGGVNQDRIRDFYCSADALALPSFAEGIPIVLMEAMAMKIACVATAINGIPELIRHEKDGLLVAPSDVNALALALARLMDDEKLRRDLGESAHRRIVEHYNLRPNVLALADVFRRRLREEMA